MKVALLQLNFKVGDLDGNARKIVSAVGKARESGVCLCVTSELAMTGYPPQDMLLNKDFVNNSWKALHKMADALRDFPPTLVGIAEVNKQGGKPLFNSAALLKNGDIHGVYRKTLLPTYDVFDESRYFEPSPGPWSFVINDKKFGVTICEDIWNDGFGAVSRRYGCNPLESYDFSEINFLLNLSGSPYAMGKQKIRENMLGKISSKYSVPVLYVNQVGGNDDLIFDGRSCAFNSGGNLIARGEPFEENILIIDPESNEGKISTDCSNREEEIFRALVLGTKDYLAKCGFKKAVLGLSGGVDSALTAVIAVSALGADNVIGVLMPSPYSSEGSVTDAEALVKNLGIKSYTIPITDVMTAFEKALKKTFGGLQEDVTEENIQSRSRGVLLMAISNKQGALLLTTGNKSELAVGYCTIYGDMSGGLAVISDLPKTMVYDIANWLNKDRGEIIPRSTINKPPSAELRPDQKDQDSLPPYDVLDEILRRRIEAHQSSSEIVEGGFAKDVVEKVLNLVSGAEFKRKQAAPGLRITDRAFGVGWRMPIACKDFF